MHRRKEKSEKKIRPENLEKNNKLLCEQETRPDDVPL